MYAKGSILAEANSFDILLDQ